ncbi:Cytochrome P450, E-class, group I [Parasponia andersonii]|uniref:Cytochrome P450, E-class, group I n=1 Tax=Parasponia andersonii TaxID=3476 RepID=A0A2P5E5D1_PARAD|nr:Cytochrome P450, E-class, group I [Parasponia andersonii]
MFQFPSSNLFLIILLFIFPLLILFFKRTKSEGPYPKLPPGPWKLPFVGNLHQLAGSSLPHRSLRDLSKKYGPVMTLHFGQILTVVVSSPQAAREVFQAQELIFAQRPVTLGMEAMSFEHPGGLMASPYGEYWKQMRKISVVELLSAKRVMSFRSVREDEAWSLVESIMSCSCDGKRPVNLSQMIISTAIATVSRAVYGKKSRGHDEFIMLLKELLTLSTGFTVPDCFPSIKCLGYVTGIKPGLERVKQKLSKVLDDVISDHEIKVQKTSTRNNIDETLEEDLVDVLLRLQQSSELKFPITTNHIKTVVMDIVGAGGETTATALEWAISELARNPRTLEKAQKEVREVVGGQKRKIEEKDIDQKLVYLKYVIKETLRLHPPAPLLGRESRERCIILGYDIPYKTKTVINAWKLGRDPEVWGPNADCFQPERFIGSSIDFKGTNFEFLPFGAGRRICPGISFSLPNMELVLANLLYHFDWNLPNGAKMAELDMSETYKISSRRRSDLYLVATPEIVKIVICNISINSLVNQVLKTIQ